MRTLLACAAVAVAAAAPLATSTAAFADGTLPATACVSGSAGACTGQGQVGPVTTPPQSVSVPVDECTP